MPQIKILTADSESIVRIGLRSLLHKRKHFVVVGESEISGTTAQLITKHNPDILIMDLCPSVPDSVETIRSLKRTHPGLKILIYTNDEHEESFFQSFHAGAHGYLLKNTDPKCVVDAVRALNSGELFFGPRVSELMLKRFLAKSRIPKLAATSLPGHLTKRETEVLTLIALGKSNPEIARKLFISFSTVHTHRTNLLKKLNAHSTAQLVRFAIEHGLVTAKDEALPS